VTDLRRRARDGPTPEGKPQHVVVFFSSWRGDAASELGEAIRSAVAEGAGAAVPAGASLAETVVRCSEAYDGQVLVILDQFEELFVYRPSLRVDEPVPALLVEAASDPASRFNFLIALREDALADLHLFKGHLPGLFESRIRLEPLSREAGRDAIVKPLELYDELAAGGERMAVEPQLVEDVLDQVGVGRLRPAQVGVGSAGGADADRDHIEAPYLQLVLQRLWEVERGQGSSVLRASTLGELGGAEEIVRDHLRGALDRLEPIQQRHASKMFHHLVTPSGTKIAHSVRDLAAYAGTSEQEVEPILRTLTAARILRPVAGEGEAEGSRYELFHDVLAGGVTAWRDEYEAQRDLERERSKSARLKRWLKWLAPLLLVACIAAILFIAQWMRTRGELQEVQAGPVTVIGDRPPSLSTGDSATFTFESDQEGVQFSCSIDGGNFEPCTSPITYTGLGAGEHEFTVKATDSDGNTGVTRSYSWTNAAAAGGGEALPDLTVADLQATGVVVANAGTTASDAFVVDVAGVGSDTAGGLEPGQTTSLTWQVCVEPEVVVTVDPDNRVAESNEDNNRASIENSC
jgi:hypothetical protein